MSDPVFHLTARDKDIVMALVLFVRLFHQRQIAEHWYGGDVTNTRRSLKRLAATGLLQRLTVLARPLPPLLAPLAEWRPGLAVPDSGAIAYRCQRRWQGRPPRPSTAWIATEQAAQLFGGVRRGELKQPTQATHDLGVAAVWLRLREVSPEWSAGWRGEDLLASTRSGQKLPDAFLVDARGEVACVIEFGGGYDAERVQAFHDDCAARGLPYQLW